MITAIVLALVIGGAVAAYAGWAGVAIAAGANPWVYVAGALVIYASIMVAITGTWFLLAWVFRAARPPEAQIGLTASVRLYWDEIRAIARSGPRMIFYRALIRDPAPRPSKAPVLLLHGVLCNAGVWCGLLMDLRARGIAPVYTLSYEPPLASIELFAEQVAAKIDAILRETGAARVAIVGHSMGGLVARAYLRQYGPAKISTIMSVGAPHHGSVHAWFFPGTCLGQLRPGNAWLAELNRAEELPPLTRLVSLWSWHDSMVAPQTSARLDGAKNVELIGIGHNALLYDRRVHALVAEELERFAAETARSVTAATSEYPA